MRRRVFALWVASTEASGLGFAQAEREEFVPWPLPDPPTAFAAPEAPRTEYFTGFEASDNYASALCGRRLRLRQGTLRARLAGSAPSAPTAAITMTARCRSTAIYLPTDLRRPGRFRRGVGRLSVPPRAVSSSSCSPASRPKTSTSSRTIRTIRCRAARSA